MTGLKVFFRSLALIGVGLLFANTGIAKETLIDRELARKAMTAYEQNPLNEDGQSAGAILFMYASKSSDIKIALREELVPWIKTADPDDPVSQQLLVAYIAGNVQSQLKRGEAVDDPHSAVLMVLKIYQLLQDHDKTLKIPELDHFVQLLAEKKLKGHLLQLSAKVHLPAPPSQPLMDRVDYPNYIGSFHYIGSQTYGSPELGISLRYGKGQQHYFDIYIYPVPVQARRYSPNTLIKSHYKNAKSDIYFAQRKGLIQEVKLNEESWLSAKDHKFPAARGIFEMQRNHMLLFSTLYITVKNDHYIKLRATYPVNDITSKGEHMLTIFKSLVDKVYIR